MRFNFIKIFNNLWTQLDCSFCAKIEYNINQVLSSAEYYQELMHNNNIDIQKGYTTKGPHKDEMGLFFNNMIIKNCGSQGEKKLFLIVLKIAEAIYINNKINKEPGS